MATRMQQRRGTASQWISTNQGNGPILSPGEIGWESDTNKFKIGDGVNHWIDLDYFTTDSAEAITDQINSAISGLIGGAPGVLDTLNELAAAINDDPTFFSTIATNLSNHESDTTNVHGILDTNELATKEYVTQEIGNSEVDQATLAGEGIDWNAGTQKFDIDSTVATKTYADDAADAAELAAKTYTDNLVGDPSIDGTAGNTIKARIDSAVSNLIDSAPSTLDTLNELAAALQDNPDIITDLQSVAAGKQDALTAGSNIDITSNVVSVTGLDSTDISDFSTAALSANQGAWDTIGAAAAAQQAAEDYADGLAINYDTAGSALTAENNAKSYADGLAVNYDAAGTASSAVSTHNSDSTSVHGIDDTAELATKAFAASLLTGATKTNITITGDKTGLTITAENGVADSTTSDLAEGTNLYFTDERAQDAVGNAVGTGLSYDDASGAISVTANTYDAYGSAAAITPSTLGLGNVDNTADADKPVSTATQTALDAKMPLSGGTFSGTVYGTNLELSGNLTVDGTFSSVPTETLTVTNPMIYMGDGNPANINDLGLVGSHTINSVYSHTGLVKDATDGKWKLFTGVTDEPTTTVNFAQATLDTLVVSTLEGNVTGDVTGNADTATALETARNIAGQSFDGTADISIAPTDLTGVTATAAEINILDGATLSTTELNYVDGVTSAIQTQIDAKAPIESPTFTGTVSGVTKAHVGLGNVDNTSDANKPVSTATQTALDLKAPLASPTFTGTLVLPSTVNGPSISTSVNLLFPTQSGHITLGGSQTTGNLTLGGGANRTTGVIGIGTGATTTGTKTINVGTGSTGGTTAITIGSADGATSNITLNGNITLPSTTSIGDVSSTELSYVNGVTSSIQTQLDAKQAVVSGVSSTEIGYLDGVTSGIQTQLDDKAPLASPALTGNPTAPTQIAGDNSTRIATTAYADAAAASAAAAIVSSAPEALNTLNELAAAINDDASYAATITTALGLKAPLDSPVLVTPDFKGRVEIIEDDSNGLPYNPPVLDIGGRLTLSTSGITFEGNTADSYETTISVVDPTADRTIEFPNASGTVALTSIIPSQSGNNGKYLTTDGTSTSWGELVVPITTGTGTNSANSEALIDVMNVSDFTSAEYMISLKQGSKVRTSKIIVQASSSAVDYVEHSIIETGGSMSGVQVYAVLDSMGLGGSSMRLNFIVTDASMMDPVIVKFSKVAL